jgi:hypothetical protein
MSNRLYSVHTGTLPKVIQCVSLPTAVEIWAGYRASNAYIEVIETRRIVGHEELTDAGAASLAARVAQVQDRAATPTREAYESAAMPRLGEYKPEVFAVNQGGE